MRKQTNNWSHWINFVSGYTRWIHIFPTPCWPLWKEAFCATRELYFSFILLQFIELRIRNECDGSLFHHRVGGSLLNSASNLLCTWNATKRSRNYFNHNNVHVFENTCSYLDPSVKILNLGRQVLDMVQRWSLMCDPNYILVSSRVSTVLLCKRTIWWMQTSAFNYCKN